MKKIFNDLILSIKKDKKKGVFILIPFILIVIGVVQFFNEDGTEQTVADNKTKFNALPLPSLDDTTETELDKAKAYNEYQLKMKKDSLLKNKYNLSEDEYFASINKDGQLSEEELAKAEYERSFSSAFGSQTSNNTKHKTYTSNSNNTTQTKDETVPVVVDNKRRRIPSDNGTMGETNASSNSNDTYMVKAVISNGNKAVKTGSTIKIRLSEDCTISGIKIKRNTVISGICSFTSERVKISVNSIRYNNQIYKCNYKVYEMDGIEGVYIPGGIKSEIVKDGADNSVDGANAQVSTPIGTFGLKSLKKGIDQPTVLIRDGHKIILKLNKK